MENTFECSRMQYGTLYHNRVFVGRLPGNGTARELADVFSLFGTICEAKILLDERGCSRRFGFVTFANKDVADKVLAMGTLVFKGKQIRIGPGVKRCIHPGTNSADDSVFQPSHSVPPQDQINGRHTLNIVLRNDKNAQVGVTNSGQPYYYPQPPVIRSDVPLYRIPPVLNRVAPHLQIIPSTGSHQASMPSHPVFTFHHKNRSSSLDSESSLNYNSPPASPMYCVDNNGYLQGWGKFPMHTYSLSPQSYSVYN